MEEQRARQRQESDAQGGENMQVEGGAPAPVPIAEPSRPAADLASVDPAGMTEEEQLQWALRMSMMQEQSAPGRFIVIKSGGNFLLKRQQRKIKLVWKIVWMLTSKMNKDLSRMRNSCSSLLIKFRELKSRIRM